MDAPLPLPLAAPKTGQTCESSHQPKKHKQEQEQEQPKKQEQELEAEQESSLCGPPAHARASDPSTLLLAITLPLCLAEYGREESRRKGRGRGVGGRKAAEGGAGALALDLRRSGARQQQEGQQQQPVEQQQQQGGGEQEEEEEEEEEDGVAEEDGVDEEEPCGAGAVSDGECLDLDLYCRDRLLCSWLRCLWQVRAHACGR